MPLQPMQPQMAVDFSITRLTTVFFSLSLQKHFISTYRNQEKVIYRRYAFIVDPQHEKKKPGATPNSTS